MSVMQKILTFFLIVAVFLGLAVVGDSFYKQYASRQGLTDYLKDELVLLGEIDMDYLKSNKKNQFAAELTDIIQSNLKLKGFNKLYFFTVEEKQEFKTLVALETKKPAELLTEWQTNNNWPKMRTNGLLFAQTQDNFIFFYSEPSFLDRFLKNNYLPQ